MRISASVVSYEVFVLSLFVPHLSVFWCLGKALLRNYGAVLVSSLISFYKMVENCMEDVQER